VIVNIIFDWSGTLVDDLPAVLSSTNHVFRQAGLTEFTLERFRAEFCLPFQKFYDRFTPQIPMAQLEQWFHGHFVEMQHLIGPIPHARVFLERCRELGKRMFVLSTMHPDHFLAQAKAYHFIDFFERVYPGVLDKQTQIRGLLEENGLAASETMFIGDMQHDIETARFGNVTSCAVLTGYTCAEQLRLSEPDLLVENLAELLQILVQRNWELGKILKA
jgi:phosphoglycolate phosphatase-like HAD superfamily hydrolase